MIKKKVKPRKRKNPYRKDLIDNEAETKKLKYRKGYLLGLVKGLRKSSNEFLLKNYSHLIRNSNDKFWIGYDQGLDDSQEQLKLIPKNKLKQYIKELEEEIDGL